MPRRKTSAEHKRELARIRKQRQRERQREVRNNLKDRTQFINSADFANYFEEHFPDEIIESLNAAGILITGSIAKENHEGVYPKREEWEDINQVPLNSLNRASLAVGAMIDCAVALANCVNEFKMKKIDAAIKSASDTNASEESIEELIQIKRTLQKVERINLPNYLVN